MPEIKITNETAAYFDDIAENGAFSWTNPGIFVGSTVRDCMELLHEVLAGATISVSRQSGRIEAITVTNLGSTPILIALQEGLDDAIDSHDDIGDEDGYLP